jgi:hypothetical protein
MMEQAGMTDCDDDQPRSMRDAGVRERRRAMLGLPHMIALTSFAEKLRRPGLQVPDFDPCDGGVEARVLFLLQKPGRMATKAGSGKRPGSGFISRDNDDSTAEATFKFMRKAKIPRERTILWNVIPWWDETHAVKGSDLKDGRASLKELIELLLPKLCAVMLVGGKAAEAKPELETIPRLCLFNSFHPSPLVRASWPEKWKAIPSEWRKVAKCIA